MIGSLITSLILKDGGSKALSLSTLISFFTGSILFFPFRKESPRVIGHREGVAIVTLGWFGATLMGSLPFFLGGVLPSFTDAFFESMSGFTTTGASVLVDIESVPKSILLWRSTTHWLGGMGIIVLSLAILPFLGVGGMQLYKAEVPSPVPDKLKPRIRDTAMALWKIYLLFTILEVALLTASDMTFLDALCHTFGTLATGGFSTKNASIGHYQSLYVEIIVMLFMLIAGINFSLHYQFVRGRMGTFIRDSECKLFLLTVLIFIILCTLSLWKSSYSSFGEAFRYASFQVISIITTTGYATADYELWPGLPQAILLFSMFIGASAGSTGGGIKFIRLMILLRHAYKELERIIHPHVVTQVKLGGKVIPQDVISSMWGFFVLYLGIFVVASWLVAASGVDMITAFSSVAATLGNIGPGFGSVGPAENYASLPEVAKWVLSFCMLLGRLEIYTVIVLLMPEFWKK
ncbi:MAG: TrkH family potassium uptake protein [Syntrophobacterales bacterium]|nr:TrkH family potassium uptake protein [Syntrophobacterales bacterium]